jgi:FkbM family methyltransferase
MVMARMTRAARRLADLAFDTTAHVPWVHRLLLAALRRYASSRNLTSNDVRLLFSCGQRLMRASDEWIVTTPGRLMFDVVDQSQSVNSLLLFRGDRFEFPWEPHTSQLLLALITPDDDMLCAGANVGYDAVLIGSRLRLGKGRCYAFEPVSTTFAALQKNIALNGLESVVHPFRVALGSLDHTAEISVAGESSSLLFHQNHKTMPTETIAVRSLDSMIRAGEIPRPTALVMDVEGFEIEVTKGAADLLQSGSLRFVMTELNRATDVVAPGSNDAVLDHLRTAGFGLFAVVDDYQGRRLPTSAACELKRITSAAAAFATGGRWLNVLAMREADLVQSIRASHDDFLKTIQVS